MGYPYLLTQIFIFIFFHKTRAWLGLAKPCLGRQINLRLGVKWNQVLNLTWTSPIKINKPKLLNGLGFCPKSNVRVLSIYALGMGGKCVSLDLVLFD